MDKKQIATNLSEQLRQLADLVDRAGNGDASAKITLGHFVDRHWHALVIGNNRETDIQKLLEDE